MEQHAMPHKTRLWVSFDSPHLGANIPIGDQWCLDYLANTYGNDSAKVKLDTKLNTPAAKEMIIHHYLSGAVTPTPYFTRTLFMQELNNMGFPQGDAGKQIRNIAIANGSGISSLTGSFGANNITLNVSPQHLRK